MQYTTNNFYDSVFAWQRDPGKETPLCFSVCLAKRSYTALLFTMDMSRVSSMILLIDDTEIASSKRQQDQEKILTLTKLQRLKPI